MNLTGKATAVLTNPILFFYNKIMKETKNTSKEKLNILQVHNFYRQPGGEDVVVMQEAHMLQGHGHKVMQYFRHNREIDSVSFCKKLLLLSESLFSVRTYVQIRNIIRKKRIDLIHVHNTIHLISPAVFYAAKKEGIPVVMTVHNYRLCCPAGTFYNHGHVCEMCMKKGLIQSVRYSCYRDSRLQSAVMAAEMGFHRRLHTYRDVNFICLTDFQRTKILTLPDVVSEHVFIKPNAFSNDPSEEKTVYNTRNTEKTNRKNEIMFVGRLEEDKGITDLLKAYRIMKKDLKKRDCAIPRLTIYGTGSMLFQCRRYVEIHDLKEVIFAGQASRNRVLKKMADVRCVVIPSRWYEGMPMVLTEAYQTKTPVIVPDFGCFSSLVEDGVNGFKYRPHDRKELAALLAMMTAEPWKMPCSFLKRDIWEQTDAEANYRQLMKIYERCIQYVRDHKKK